MRSSATHFRRVEQFATKYGAALLRFPSVNRLRIVIIFSGKLVDLTFAVSCIEHGIIGKTFVKNYVPLVPVLPNYNV